LRFAVAALVGLPLVLAASRVSAPDGELCELIASTPNEDRLHLAIFSDFQCPHCQALHRSLRGVRDNPDVVLELRHFPLEAECNPRVSRTRSRGACLQARAAICANADGRVLELSDRLFEAGPTDVGGLTVFAESLGMNAPRFASCLESPETAEALNRDVRAAIENGVHGTPTLFLNGRRLARVPKAEGIACLRAYRRVHNAEASAR
jgi:protein-disulfide isomerase